MGLVNIDAKILESLRSSTCFGIAYDENAPECIKLCDVSFQCKCKCSGESINTPVKKQNRVASIEKSEDSDDTLSFDKGVKEVTPKRTSHRESKKADVPKKKAETINSNAPDFKDHSLDDLKKLAAENSIEWKDYGNDNITRMRLIMSLKKLY